MTGDEREVRAARRAFIRDHHPDAGGDAVAFAAGLRRYDERLAAARHAVPTVAATNAPRYQVRRSRRLDRVLRRVVRRALDDRAGRPRRHLL